MPFNQGQGQQDKDKTVFHYVIVVIITADKIIKKSRSCKACGSQTTGYFMQAELTVFSSNLVAFECTKNYI